MTTLSRQRLRPLCTLGIVATLVAGPQRAHVWTIRGASLQHLAFGIVRSLNRPGGVASVSSVLIRVSSAARRPLGSLLTILAPMRRASSNTVDCRQDSPNRTRPFHLLPDAMSLASPVRLPDRVRCIGHGRGATARGRKVGDARRLTNAEAVGRFVELPALRAHAY